MTTYTPDKWVVVECGEVDTGNKCFKIFGSWSGGYLDGDSWKLSSGFSIDSAVTAGGGKYNIPNYSGSLYIVSSDEGAYGYTIYCASIFSNFCKQAESAPNIHWIELSYEDAIKLLNMLVSINEDEQ